MRDFDRTFGIPTSKLVFREELHHKYDDISLWQHICQSVKDKVRAKDGESSDKLIRKSVWLRTGTSP